MLSAGGRRGSWEVEGGKDEMCDCLGQAGAAFAVLQASTDADFDPVQIVREGLTWTSARMKYSPKARVHASGRLAMTLESKDTLLRVRRLSGIRIKSVELRSTGGI